MNVFFDFMFFKGVVKFYLLVEKYIIEDKIIIVICIICINKGWKKLEI